MPCDRVSIPLLNMKLTYNYLLKDMQPKYILSQ